MKSLLHKSFGLGAVLTLLAGPALAQPYYEGGHYGAPGYSVPYRNDGWQHERHEAMWRAHERHEAWWHSPHGYGYHRGGDDDHPYRWGY